MRIHELVRNPDFSFNVPFRILEYLGGNETATCYDSTKCREGLTRELLKQEILSINTDEYGVVEIEFMDTDW